MDDSTPSHLLITGGTGFIGQPLVQQLSAAGHEVSVLTRNSRRARTLLPTEARCLDSLADLDGESPVDGIVNLAGEPLAEGRWSTARKRQFLDSRIGTTAALFDHFSRAGTAAPRVLVNGSAIGFYGLRGDEALSEDDAGTPCFSHELCREWESEAARFAGLGTRVALLRTGIVLDAGGGALARMLPFFRLGLGGPTGSGAQWMSWIHRADLVQMIVRCLEDSTLDGPINGTAPQPVTNAEFASTLGDVLGRPAFLPQPGFMMRLAFGEMADELLLSGQRVLPERMQRSGFEFRFPNLRSALAAATV